MHSPADVLIRELVIAPLAALAVARERLMTHPDSCPPARADGCPECGASPTVGVAAGDQPRSYRARVPGGERCTNEWHDA